ncbi:hypothetical protein [Fredinandcohnia quinoae]|uniref:Uncharacterized protein n=1 Tax=Fredinandcohnia quinoae TaxID=2918902 RepID=A0AAW5E4J9_9BACI|nr:hypothetical protein [Fredinandcohnia sp. SECRCQ15]MCH1626474.1 hypothetical protein [Fredinandcohnia sp. SECRCQ15]
MSTENEQGTNDKKKVSLQDLVKQQLANKKQNQTNGSKAGNLKGTNQRMQSQQTKKPSNTRRKMGS